MDCQLMYRWHQNKAWEAQKIVFLQTAHLNFKLYGQVYGILNFSVALLPPQFWCREYIPSNMPAAQAVDIKVVDLMRNDFIHCKKRKTK